MTIKWKSTHEIKVIKDDFEVMIFGRTDKVTDYLKNYSRKESISFLEELVNSWTAGLEDAEYYTITEEAIKQIAIELYKYIKKNYNLGA